MLSWQGLSIEKFEQRLLEEVARTDASEEVAKSLKSYIRGAKKKVAVDKRHTLLLLLHNQVIFTYKS
jgi:hypothetical protein